MMSEVFELGEITINLTRKSVKNVHLTVRPPEGRVTLVAPTSTRTEVARAYAISKLGWIRLQQQALRDQARDSSWPEGLATPSRAFAHIGGMVRWAKRRGSRRSGLTTIDLSHGRA